MIEKMEEESKQLRTELELLRTDPEMEQRNHFKFVCSFDLTHLLFGLEYRVSSAVVSACACMIYASVPAWNATPVSLCVCHFLFDPKEYKSFRATQTYCGPFRNSSPSPVSRPHYSLPLFKLESFGQEQRGAPRELGFECVL
jgi:hypothetical protein